MTLKDPNPFGFRVQGGMYGHPIKRGSLLKGAIAFVSPITVTVTVRRNDLKRPKSFRV